MTEAADYGKMKKKNKVQARREEGAEAMKAVSKQTIRNLCWVAVIPFAGIFLVLGYSFWKMMKYDRGKGSSLFLLGAVLLQLPLGIPAYLVIERLIRVYLQDALQIVAFIIFGYFVLMIYAFLVIFLFKRMIRKTNVEMLK